MGPPARPVLLVGAGPAGMALALELHRFGVPTRLLEQRTESWRPSRAMVVQPRTLELLARLGVAERLVAAGHPLDAFDLHARSRVRHLELPAVRSLDSRYRCFLVCPQAVLERVLADRLAECGIGVERGVSFLGARDLGDRVLVTTGRSDGSSGEIEASYLVGCDGARSAVRAAAGIGFPGGTFRHSVVLADVEAGEREATFHVFASAGGVLALAPVGEQARWRLVATRTRSGPDGPPRSLTAAEVIALAERESRGELRLESVAWSNELVIERRLATRFRAGRVLLAGDAAHVNSPGGAQGMNSAVGDAANLGWKLALVARVGAPDALLDSYDRERRPAARHRLVLTSLIFAAESATDTLTRFVRGEAAPVLAPFALRSGTALSLALRVLGQLRIRYRVSELNGSRPALVARRGAPGAGERVADQALTTAHGPALAHDLLGAARFVLLVCTRAHGADDTGLASLGARYAGILEIEQVGPSPPDRPGRRARRTLGFRRSGQLLVRPDGYVALRRRGRSRAALEAYLDRWAPGPGGGAAARREPVETGDEARGDRAAPC